MIPMPENVKRILHTLTEHGYEAYAVGGCVRDSILHRVPNDWDITTNALPAQVKALFRRTIDTGIQHGTVTIMIGEEGYEVTTYRVDGDYSDGRHPDSVAFSSSLSEDLKRRDFTINAMAYNDEEGLVDLFGGEEDLTKGVIRCVGDPSERFSEDALRLLRAIRFSAQLGFTIEEHTAEAIRELAPTIAKVSRERIHTELGKTLLSANPHYVGKAGELGIWSAALPAYDKLPDPTVTEALLRTLAGRTKEEADLAFRYAAMLYPLGENEVRKALKSLKLDNATIEKASLLVRGITECRPQTDEAALRLQASRYGASLYTQVEELGKAIALTAKDETMALSWKQEQALFETIVRRGDALSIKELELTGNDLIAMGINPGRQMGAILQELLSRVLAQPDLNTKERLRQIVTNDIGCDKMK